MHSSRLKKPVTLPPEALAILAKIRRDAPRVQCLTNTVAQTLTANVLLAIGANVSMAQHPEEVVEMSVSADAVLINLGTMDVMREMAIERLLQPGLRFKGPIIIDPVFADRSALRLGLARRLTTLPRVVVKANTAETAAIAAFVTPGTHSITTGEVDRVTGPQGQHDIACGHPMMMRTTATGCALGAVVAAFATSTDDMTAAAIAALTCFGLAGEEAALRSAGPGLFPAHLVQALADMSDHACAQKEMNP